MPNDVPPELSYLALVERNNELLQRLVDVFSSIGWPVELRPPPSWSWRSPDLPGMVPYYSIRVELDASERGLMARLVTADGMQIWRHVWEYAEPDPRVWSNLPR